MKEIIDPFETKTLLSSDGKSVSFYTPEVYWVSVADGTKLGYPLERTPVSQTCLSSSETSRPSHLNTQLCGEAHDWITERNFPYTITRTWVGDVISWKIGFISKKHAMMFKLVWGISVNRNSIFA